MKPDQTVVKAAIRSLEVFRADARSAVAELHENGIDPTLIARVEVAYAKALQDFERVLRGLQPVAER
jgi:hypothetical protein